MAEVKALKNFLSVALGMVVRKARLEARLSYDDVTGLTEIGSSYFQSFEQGKVNFHISKAYTLYNLLKEVYPKGLNGFMEILGLISVIEERGTEFQNRYLKQSVKQSEKSTREGKNRSYQDGLIKGFRELASANPAYRKLFDRIISAGISSAYSNEEIHSKIVSGNLVLEVSLFISDYVSYAVPLPNRIDNNLSKILDDVPTSYLDFVTALKTNIKKLNLLYTARDVIHWEFSHSREIKDLTFFMESEIQLNPIFDEFLFPYLFHEQFSRATFYMCINYRKDYFGIDHFKKHLQNLYQSYADMTKNNNYVLTDAKWDEIKGKLEFKYLYHDDRTDRLFQSTRIHSIGTNYFWIYSLTGNTYAAFQTSSSGSDDLDEKAIIYPLTVGELVEKLGMVQAIIDDN